MPEARFRATVLSPVHIGTGESAGPEEYFIETQNQPPQLCRFAAVAVLSRADAEHRRRLEAMLDSGKAEAAVTELRQLARQHRAAIHYRCELGPSAGKFLERWLSDPARSRGEVRPMPHNPYDGRVLIPGSAIKGALRTAVLSSLVMDSQHQAVLREFAGRIRLATREGEMSRIAMDLEKRLIRAGRDIEADPFRFLKVEDAYVAADGNLRVDEARVVYANRDAGKAGPPMFVERLLSRADGRPVQFEVRIRVASDAEMAKARPDSRMDLKRILAVADSFFRRRYNAESSRFPAYYDSAFRDPTAVGGGWLLRIGRYSHFESLSVEGLRRAFNRQKKCWVEQGATRTVCELANGKRGPFGWVLLEPAA